MLNSPKNSYENFIELIKKKVSEDFYVINLDELSEATNEIEILGIPNFKCIRGDASILINYDKNTIPYVLMFIYIIGWDTNTFLPSIKIKNNDEIKQRAMSDEEFLDKLLKIVQNETNLVLELEDCYVYIYFSYVYYIITPDQHDEYYLIESLKRIQKKNNKFKCV